MKKKFLTLLLMTTLSASAVACGGNSPEANNNSTSSDISSTIPPESSESQPENDESENSAELESAPEDNSVEVSEKTLDDIESYLLEKGVLSGERIHMEASMIGGIDGFKYKDSIGEIYEYDVESEEYQKLANGEEIPLAGMDGYTVKATSVNGKFVLFGADIPQELIDAFNSFE